MITPAYARNLVKLVSSDDVRNLGVRNCVEKHFVGELHFISL